MENWGGYVSLPCQTFLESRWSVGMCTVLAMHMSVKQTLGVLFADTCVAPCPTHYYHHTPIHLTPPTYPPTNHWYTGDTKLGNFWHLNTSILVHKHILCHVHFHVLCSHNFKWATKLWEALCFAASAHSQLGGRVCSTLPCNFTPQLKVSQMVILQGQRTT